MVMRWLPDEEAVKTLFEKLSFTVDISCDLISYQMLGEAHEIAAQDYKAIWRSFFMVMSHKSYGVTIFRVDVEDQYSGLLSAYKLSSVQLSCTSPRCWKKSDLHLFGWKHLNAVILYCYHSNENN